ncbi:MAG: FmdB family zinc ribbon protein [Fimbriimonas sp.]
MPTYVYACSTCDKTFEHDQRITEDALTTCLCGKEGRVKRVIQPIAVMFKGEGFHINDYAAKPAAEPAAAAPAAPAAPAAASAEATTPTPAAPAATTTPSTSTE